MLGIVSMDENIAESLSEALDSDDIFPRAPDEAFEPKHLQESMQIDFQEQNNADFFGSFNDIQDIDEDMAENIDFEINIDDMDLGLDDLPDLDDDSENEDENEFVW